MRIFSAAFAGGLFGKLAAALLIAVCALLGFGPEEWAAYLLHGLPQVITPRVAQGSFLGLAVVVALSMIWPRLSRAGRTAVKPQSHGVFLMPSTYWTLCETVTWVAFGEAVKADQIETWMEARAGAEDMDAAIKQAIMRVREAARRGDLHVWGQKDGSTQYKEIEASYWASNVALYFAQDKIGLDGSSSDIGAVLNNDLPTFNRVIFYREQVLKLWPEGGKRLDVSQEVTRS